MYPPKAEKIDLNTEYPCPCRRRGRLVPIVLTEALGCNRCQQIFVVEENGYTIEQLSTHYPYKQAWHWTGQEWNHTHTGFRDHYVSMALGMIVLSILIWLPVALNLVNPNIVPWLIVMVLAILLSISILHWFVYRR